MDPVEALANRWRLIHRTLESGIRRQVVESLPEAVRILLAVDQSTQMPDHLIQAHYFDGKPSVKL